MPGTAWIVLAWIIAIAGVALIAWGRLRVLRARRPGGRRRCPRCWHDLSATEGLRCPECGRVAGSERHLHRTRRRWLPGIAGLGLLAMAPSVARAPLAADHGWPAIVPTPVLIAVFPVADHLGPSSWRRGTGLPVPPASRTRRIAGALAAELLRRAALPGGSDLHSVHWRMVGELSLRMMDADEAMPWVFFPTRPIQLLRLALEQGRLTAGAQARADRMSGLEFDVPAALPAEVAVTARIRVAMWRVGTFAFRIRDRNSGELIHEGFEDYRSGVMGSLVFHPWTDGRTRIGRTGRSDTTLALTIELDELPEPSRNGDPAPAPRRIRSYDVDIPIRVSGPLEEAFERRADDAVGAALLAGLGRPYPIQLSSNSVALPFAEAPARRAARDAGIDTIAVRFELRDGAEVVARTSAWWDVPSFGQDSGDLQYYIGEMIISDAIALRWVDPSVAPRGGGDPRDLRLHVISDPAVATRRAAASVIWSGEVSIPWPPKPTAPAGR